MTVTDKTKKKITDLALITMSLLILLGAALIVYLRNAEKNVIKLSIAPEETESIRFEHLGLRPGESCEYTILLSSEYASDYLLTLRFSDQDPTLTLKQFTYVRMEKDGIVLCDTRLSELFAQEAITVPISFADDAKNEMRIIYYMPEDVGNEAQNAQADFKLLVTATNE